MLIFLCEEDVSNLTHPLFRCVLLLTYGRANFDTSSFSCVCDDEHRAAVPPGYSAFSAESSSGVMAVLSIFSAR